MKLGGWVGFGFVRAVQEGAKGVNKGGGQDHVLRSVRRWKGSEDTRSREMKDTGKVQCVE